MQIRDSLLIAGTSVLPRDLHSFSRDAETPPRFYESEFLPSLAGRVWQTLWLLFITSGLTLVASLEGVLATDRVVEQVLIARVLLLATCVLVLEMRPTRIVALGTAFVSILMVVVSVATAGLMEHDWVSGATIAVAISFGTAALLPWGPWVHAALTVVMAASLPLTSSIVTGDPFRGMTATGTLSFLLCLTTSICICHGLSQRRSLLAMRLRKARAAEERMRASQTVISAMHHAELGFIADRGPRDTFEGLLGEVLTLGNSRYGFIGELMVAPDGHRYLKCHAVSETAWHDAGPELSNSPTRELEFHKFDNLFGRVLTTGKMVVSNNPAGDPWRGGLPDGHPRLKNFLGIPLVSGGELVGMVGLANRPRDYDEVLISQLEPLLTSCAQIARSLRSERLRKHAEEEVRQLNANLEERVRERTAALESANRDLTRFSASVAHDLRQPLRAIASFSQLLVADYGQTLDATGQDYLQRVFVAATRMDVLIDNLLALARLGRAELFVDRVDLGEFAAKVVEDLRSESPRREVAVEIGGGLFAKGDPALLRVLLEHLIGNAWKFTKTKSKAILQISVLWSEGRRVYRIRDNGVGFDMRFAGKLFRVFERLHGDQKFEGLGIGLAMVETIVRRHRGRVWAEATPNQGATFYFTLEP